MNTVTFVNRISSNDVITQTGEMPLYIESANVDNKLQIEKLPVWVQQAINMIARCNNGTGMNPTELQKAYHAVAGYRKYMVNLLTGKQDWEATSKVVDKEFGRTRSQWKSRVETADVRLGMSPRQMIAQIKRDIRERVSPVLHTAETAAKMVDSRLVQALEEETAALSDEFSVWDTRREVGDAELCRVRFVVPNFAEVTNGPEYNAYEDEDAQGGEWMSFHKSDDEDLSDGEELGRREFASAYSERKEKCEELLETLKEGNVSRGATLRRAKTLMDMKVIWAKDYWFLFRMAKVYARIERNRLLAERDNEVSAMNFA